jgi:hypothetical protein
VDCSIATTGVDCSIATTGVGCSTSTIVGGTGGTPSLANCRGRYRSSS